MNEKLGGWLTPAGCLRTFQIDRFLSASDFDEPKYWDVGAADYVVAFRSVQATPTNAFDRGQRSKLANRVLRVLLLANMSNLAKTTDHLVLLVKLIQVPNKSFNILTNESEMSRKTPAQPEDEMALICLARGIDGVINWSEDNVHSVKALKQLAHAVMEYDSHMTVPFRDADHHFQLFIFDARSEKQHPVPPNTLPADGALSRKSLQERKPLHCRLLHFVRGIVEPVF